MSGRVHAEVQATPKSSFSPVRTGFLQRSSASHAGPATVPPIVQEVLHSPGQPLDPATRAYMEPRFGHDFSRVRVHTDARAAESARTVNALAYTVVPNIVFNKGEYAPQTTAGKELLAHELTHVVQQRTEAVQTNLTIGAANDAHELEADESAESVVQGNIMNRSGFSQTSHNLQRDCGPAAIGNVGGCTSRGGDITDFGGSSDRLILFDVNCDEFLPGEVSKLRRLAPTILPNDIVEIDGFASEEGDPIFNDNLSCARAHAAESELLRQSVAATIALFKHGATPGFRDDRRSAVISLSTPAPTGCTMPTNPDLFGSANNPTTDSEATVVITNPIDAISANGAANDASAAAAASGLAGPHLGPQDAFRHCVWNCLMAQRIGASEAEKFATAHENSGPSSIPFDNQMDLHNNATGRSLGTPGANCSTACRGALTSGQLRTIRGPNTRPQATPPVPAACIGASDQPWP